VIVTINEDQDASDGTGGSSTVTLQFLTNEIQGPDNFVTFGAENVVCNGVKLLLNNYGTSVTTFSIHLKIPSTTSPGYTCTYDYPLNGETKSALIFTQPVLSQLMPILLKPIPSSSNISISYNPDNNPPNCQVQATANAPGGTATGPSEVEENNKFIYPDPKFGTLNVGSLSGLGNISMTRTCVPPSNNFNNQNKNDDAGTGCQCNGSSAAAGFDKLSLTYTSTATYEVSWVQPGAPTITTS
jgi:hypothetical protein